MQKSLKFTIITPTILRPSLAETCRSISVQSYKNWNHLIIVDLPNVDLKQLWSTNPNLTHFNRRWLQCSKAHKNFGNTCRRSLYDQVPPDTDYILYMDDDNTYSPNALSILANKLIEIGCPEWGVFPMHFLGRRFCDPLPRLNHTDANQLFHRPIIAGQQIRWPSTDHYAADGELVDWLSTLTSPVVLGDLPELTNLPKHSFGQSLEQSKYTVVIPNKFYDIIDPLLQSIDKFESNSPKILIVADNHTDSHGHKIVTLTNRFIFSKSANAGIDACAPDDVILVNDDVRLLQPNTFDKLSRDAYSDPKLGILTPLIDGGCGNVFMSSHKVNALWKGNRGNHLMFRRGTGNDFISFACVYLKRAMIDQIGLMDENFIAYGRDDTDYCIRAVKAGWKIGITRNCTVRHGDGGNEYRRGENWNTSYKRTKMTDARQATRYFHEKYPKESKFFAFPLPYTKVPKSV